MLLLPITRIVSSFLELLPNIDDPDALEAAQQILISSGAVSYCAYQMVERHRAAYEMLRKLPLVNPQPIEAILNAFSDSLVAFLKLSGVEVDVNILFDR